MDNHGYKILGTSGFTASLKYIRDEEILLPAQMESYWSGVGMLLYLVKHSQSNIANPTQKLGKSLTKATCDHYKELLYIVFFLKKTQILGICLRVKEAHLILNGSTLLWYMKAYTNVS